MKKSVNVQAAAVLAVAVVGSVVAYMLVALRRRKRIAIEDRETTAHRLHHTTQDSSWNRSKFSNAANSFGAATR